MQTIPAGLRVPGAAGSAPGPHLGEPAASARTGGERETKKKKKGKKRKRGGGGLKKKKGGEGKGGEGCAAHTPTTGALGRRSCAPSAPAPPRGAPLYMASLPPPPASAPPPPRPPAERRPPRPSRPRPHPPGPAPPLALPHRRGSSALYVSARLASRQSCVTARVNACPRQSLPSRPSAPQGGGRDPLRTTAPITAAAMAPRSWEPPIAARRRLGRLAARRVQRRALQPPQSPAAPPGLKIFPAGSNGVRLAACPPRRLPIGHSVSRRTTSNARLKGKCPGGARGAALRAAGAARRLRAFWCLFYLLLPRVCIIIKHFGTTATRDPGEVGKCRKECRPRGLPAKRGFARVYRRGWQHCKQRENPNSGSK